MSRIAGLVVAVTLTLASAAPALAQDAYGAFAFSQGDGAYGYGSFAPSRAAAEARALQECGTYGGRACRIVLWFRNSCASLATGDKSGYGWRWDIDAAAAERGALAECRQRDSGCRTRGTVCTSQ